MNYSLKEPNLTYALNESGKMVHISEVQKGLDCKCRCPKCNERMVAKIGNGGRQPHFAHQKDSDCQGAYMTALHKMAEQIIEEKKAVMAPAYKNVGSQMLIFTTVEVESRTERKDMQPDLVGVDEGGYRWIIEIRNTHEVDSTKKRKIKESAITCLEIDVRKQSLEELPNFLLYSDESREWINNPNYDSLFPDEVEEMIPLPSYPSVKYSVKKLEKSIEDYMKDSNFGVFPNDECECLCKYQPYHGMCIYKEGEGVHNGVTYVVCNIKKRLQDGTESILPSNRKNPARQNHVSIEEEPIQDFPLSAPVKKRAVDPLQIIESAKTSISTADSESLPFEPFWTLDVFFQQLASGSYVSDTGRSTQVVKYDRDNDYIIILYQEQKGFCLFHIDKISVSNGNLERCKIASYSQMGPALTRYNNCINSAMTLISPGPEEDPPF